MSIFIAIEAGWTEFSDIMRHSSLFIRTSCISSAQYSCWF